MNEPFLITVNNEEYKARFERYGYTHRIAVLIGEETIFFEPDEEGNYRALGNINSVELLSAIAKKLKNLLH